MGTEVSTCLRVPLRRPRRSIAYRRVRLVLMREGRRRPARVDRHIYETGSRPYSPSNHLRTSVTPAASLTTVFLRSSAHFDTDPACRKGVLVRRLQRTEHTLPLPSGIARRKKKAN